jgi:alkylresorcinol/alkylpyrone synthase
MSPTSKTGGSDPKHLQKALQPMARIAAVGESFPAHYHTQMEMLEALKAVWKDTDADLRKLERLHRNTRVRGRHLALPLEAYRARPWGETNRLWIEMAEKLGAEAVTDALERAGLTVTDVDAIVFVSVTGIATPSIDARLVNRLGLRDDIKRLPLFGLGCVAGAAGLARSADLIQAFDSGVVVLLSVEMCSLTLQLEDTSPANMIAAGLFGDGAAAVVLVGKNTKACGPSIVATRSVLYPKTEHAMGWDISERGFHLILSPEVPDLIQDNLRNDVDRFLGDAGLRRSDIRAWMAHTGGPKIMSAMERSLALPPGAMDVSWETLATMGNISSASVLQVLKKTMESSPPESGSYGLLMAMGPGFCSELVLVRW